MSTTDGWKLWDAEGVERGIGVMPKAVPKNVDGAEPMPYHATRHADRPISEQLALACIETVQKALHLLEGQVGLARMTAAQASPAPQPGPLRISTDSPTVSVLLVAWTGALKLKGVTDGHVKDSIDCVTDAAASQCWTFPSQMTPATIRTYLEARKLKGNGPRYLNHQRAYIGTFWDFCKGEGAVSGDNPIDAVPRARVKRRQAFHVPTEDEVVRLIVGATQDWRKKDRWLVRLVQACSHYRIGTLRGMKPEHAHEAEFPPYFEVPPELVKNGEPTRVWMTAEVARWITEHKRINAAKIKARGLLFLSVGKGKEFDRDLEAANLPKKAHPGAPAFVPHSLRHFASNRLKWAEVFTDEERQAQNGHKTLEMTTRVYTDPSHIQLGQKIYRLKDLLPDGFRPRWGQRTEKTGQSVLAPPGETDKLDDAKPNKGLNRVHPPDSLQEPACDPSGPAWRHDGNPVRAGSCRESSEGRQLDEPDTDRGKRFESAYPDLDQNDPDINGVYLELIEVQARLIAALLRKGRGNGPSKASG